MSQETMTYQQALRAAFVGMLLAWRNVPEAWSDMLDDRAARLPFTLGALLLRIMLPAFLPLAPLLALAIQADERKTAEQVAKAKREVDEHYGSRRQRL